MLGERWTIERLSQVLLPEGEYRPFPRADDRGVWGSLPDDVRGVLVRAGEERLSFEWPALSAARYMDYVRDGNRTRYENAYFDRRKALIQLAMAECAEGEGRFMEQIMTGLWCICEESSWVVPAHLWLSRDSRGDALPDIADPVIDLFAGETAGLLAWTVYLLGSRLDAVSGRIRERVKLEVGRRVHDPYLSRTDFWWMGFEPDRRTVNNWNPWINANVISSFLLLESDPERRLQGIAKAMRSLDAFLSVYPSDGGCDEGPSYWSRAGGSLFDALEQLYGATNGAVDVYGDPLIREIGRYIYRVHIAGTSYINFADGDATVAIEAELVERYGQRIGDDRLVALGASAVRPESLKPGLITSMLRYVPRVLRHGERQTAEAKPPLVRDSWMGGLQVMAAREREGDASGLFLAAKGGHNAESHNHNDIGHFIAYLDGKPVLIDVGVETYTAKTFGENRYDIWTMQSQYHNVPVVNGFGQREGRDYRAESVNYRADEDEAGLEMDLAGAYPHEAGIERWSRRCTLHRGERPHIEVIDRYRLRDAAGPLSFHLVTAHPPRLTEDGGIAIGAGGSAARLSYDAKKLSPSVESIAIGDEKLRKSWGEAVYRIVLKAIAPEPEGEFRIVIERLE